MVSKPLKKLSFLMAFILAQCFCQAQLIKMNSFSFGYYGHLSKLAPISYSEFYNGFKFQNQLPELTSFTESNEEIRLRVQGVSFEFEAQFLNSLNEGTRHFVGLSFRNGFIRSSRFNNDDKNNEVFYLNDKQNGSDAPQYSMKMKSEIFGIGLSYKYALLKHERLQLFAGTVMNFDVPASTKLYATPLAAADIDTNETRLINHDYFLKNDADLFLAPFLQASLKIWNSTHINFRYNYGYYNLSMSGLRTSGASRLFELGLKFKV